MAFAKILVVDDGSRTTDYALSAELAGLGYASVTASLEAADEVLASMPSPAAILMQLPRSARSDRDSFLALAERLKAESRTAGVPIIFVEQPFGSGPGSFGAALEERIGPRVLSEPDL